MPDSVQVQARWVLDPNIQPAFANQILLQIGPPTSDGQADGFYLTFGHLNPPAYGTVEEAREHAGEVLPVIPLGRFFVSRERLQDMHRSIGEVLSLDLTQGTNPTTRTEEADNDAGRSAS